jgi:hypothetical protein
MTLTICSGIEALMLFVDEPVDPFRAIRQDQACRICSFCQTRIVGRDALSSEPRYLLVEL